MLVVAFCGARFVSLSLITIATVATATTPAAESSQYLSVDVSGRGLYVLMSRCRYSMHMLAALV